MGSSAGLDIFRGKLGHVAAYLAGRVLCTKLASYFQIKTCANLGRGHFRISSSKCNCMFLLSSATMVTARLKARLANQYQAGSWHAASLSTILKNCVGILVDVETYQPPPTSHRIFSLFLATSNTTRNDNLDIHQPTSTHHVCPASIGATRPFASRRELLRADLGIAG
jgi:hypothetical protein